MEAEYITAGRSAFRYRIHVIVFAAFALYYWIIPLVCRGGGMRALPLTPPAVSVYHTTGRLFALRPKVWSCDSIEIKLAGANQPWQSLDLEPFSPMSVFGPRQRIERIFRPTKAKERDEEVRLRLAAWLGKRWQQIFPNSTRIAQVRFVRVKLGQEMAALRGASERWWDPPSTSVPPRQLTVYGTYALSGPGQRAVRFIPTSESGNREPPVIGAQRPPIPDGIKLPPMVGMPSQSMPGPTTQAAPPRLSRTGSGNDDSAKAVTRPTFRGAPAPSQTTSSNHLTTPKAGTGAQRGLRPAPIRLPSPRSDVPGTPPPAGKPKTVTPPPVKP